jgi:hypothetical protein
LNVVVLDESTKGNGLPPPVDLRTIHPFPVKTSTIRNEVALMKFNRSFPNMSLDRRSFLTKAIGAAGVSAAGYLNLAAADPPSEKGANFLKEVAENERVARSRDAKPMIGVGDKLKITKVETIFVGALGH